jgi:hypothetical protein
MVYHVTLIDSFGYLGIGTKQVGYTLAFVHADLEDDVSAQMTRGLEQKDHFYKLKKNLYR